MSRRNRLLGLSFPVRLGHGLQGIAHAVAVRQSGDLLGGAAPERREGPKRIRRVTRHEAAVDEMLANGLFRQGAKEQLVHGILEHLPFRALRRLIDNAGQLAHEIALRECPLGHFFGLDAKLRLVAFLFQPVRKGALILHGLEGGKDRLLALLSSLGKHRQVSEAH